MSAWLTVTHSLDADGPVHIRVTDVLSREVHAETRAGRQGRNGYRLPAGHLKNGVYLLHVHRDGRQEAKQIGRVYISRDAYWNMDNAFMNAWRPGNTGTDMPRLAGGGSQDRNNRPSTRFLEDGSFLRIRNVSLSYNLPEGLSKRLLLQTARVYVSATNALTFTRYTGYDPEVNSLAGSPQNQGVDLIGYPLPRVFTLGVSANF